MIIKIQNEDVKKRVDIFLTQYLKDYPRAKLSAFIDKNGVFVNNKKQKSSYKLKLNDEIDFELENFKNSISNNFELAVYKYNLDIIYEDDDVIVINKPKEMLTHPTKYDKEKTLSNALLYHCGNNLSDIAGADRLGIVHRLDKNTSGLIICAKNNSSHIDLARQIKEKTLKRKYLALALGKFEKSQGTIDKCLIHYLKDNVKMCISEDNQGLRAITNYKVIEEFEGCSLVELELKTGRTHQIRAHLAYLKHPIFGDKLYGALGFQKKEFNNLKTKDQLLQSYYISFIHPETKEKMQFQLEEQRFSDDFIKVLNYLRREKNV